MADEVFTYDNIYDMLHAEKFSSELQNISNVDLKKIQKYLEDKKTLLDKQEESTQIFSSQKRAMIQIEIDNALRALKDLYEFREKKIINRAVFSVRGGNLVMDTTNMLEHESIFYNRLIQIIPQNRDDFFNLLSPEPVGSTSTPQPEPQEVESQKASPEETIKEVPQEPLEENPEDLIEIKMVKVKVLKKVASFTGEDLKTYGPYTTNDEADIPEGIANLLIGNDKVELLKTEGSNENEISKTNEELLSEVQEAHSTTDQTSENQS